MSDKPIVIGYCRGSMVHGDFAHSLAMLSMRAVAAGIWLGHHAVTTTLICAGRNSMVNYLRTNLKSGFSHLLMLDSDMMFPAHTLERLLSHDVPVVGATYCMRMEPRCLVHRDLNDSSRLPALGEYENDLMPVTRIGMGCILIRADVFDQLEKCLDPEVPFFEVVYRSRTAHTSEDNTFCDHVNHHFASQSYPIFCDVRLSYEVRHVGLYPYSTDDVQAVREGEKLTFVNDAVTVADSCVTDNTPQIRSWRCFAYGGGGEIELDPMSQSDAASIVARDFGTVGFVDKEFGFIFYKPKGWIGSPR